MVFWSPALNILLIMVRFGWAIATTLLNSSKSFKRLFRATTSSQLFRCRMSRAPESRIELISSYTSCTDFVRCKATANGGRKETLGMKRSKHCWEALSVKYNPSIINTSQLTRFKRGLSAVGLRRRHDLTHCHRKGDIKVRANVIVCTGDNYVNSSQRLDKFLLREKKFYKIEPQLAVTTWLRVHAIFRLPD